MTTITKYSSEALGWHRKPGPPRIWRVAESSRKTPDGKTLRFSIQEIPEDRYEDVLEHMSDILPRDEPCCVNAGISNDPAAMADFRKMWCFALQQGIVVGAFLVDENNPKPLLVGTNMIMVKCAATERGIEREIKMTSASIQKIIRFMADLEKEIDIRKFYNVDKYITAVGLAVARDYRNMGIGYHLLKARDEVSMAYDIHATSTVFSGPFAQKAAARAGMEILIERDFADIKNDDGSEMFPGITAKICWLMGKRFTQQK